MTLLHFQTAYFGVVYNNNKKKQKNKKDSNVQALLALILFRDFSAIELQSETTKWSTDLYLMASLATLQVKLNALVHGWATYAVCHACEAAAALQLQGARYPMKSRTCRGNKHLARTVSHPRSCFPGGSSTPCSVAHKINSCQHEAEEMKTFAKMICFASQRGAILGSRFENNLYSAMWYRNSSIQSLLPKVVF